MVFGPGSKDHQGAHSNPHNYGSTLSGASWDTMSSTTNAKDEADSAESHRKHQLVNTTAAAGQHHSSVEESSAEERETPSLKNTDCI